MTKDLRTIVLDILSIVGFADDKDRFADNFMLLCSHQALVALLSTLSSQDQKKAQQQLDNAGSVEQARILLADYFTDKEVNDAIKEATAFMLKNYIDTVSEELTQEQQDKLAIYIQSVDI